MADRYKKRFLLLTLIIAAVVILYVSAAGEYLTFDGLKTYKNSLYDFVQRHYSVSLVIFIFLYFILAGLSMPGGPVLTMAGGFVFGIFPALMLVEISATMGAAAAFFLSRFFIGSWVQEKYARRLETFNRGFEQDGIYYLLTLRFAPIFPFTWINLFCGLTTIRTITFTWTTVIGILPGTLLAAYTGSQLRKINSPNDLLSPGIWLAFFLLSILAFIPVIYKRKKQKDARNTPR
jgi:uncharacterized membrane protein YdjX (TVP38/TMEM64 family)